MLQMPGLTGGDGGTEYISVSFKMPRSGLMCDPCDGGSLTLETGLVDEDRRTAVSLYIQLCVN